MAGLRESVKDRKRRENAIADQGKDSAKESARYRSHKGERAMIASAAKIDLNDRNSVANLRRRRQAWQTEAWDYVSEIGEIRYVVNFAGNLMSKVRLFAALRPESNSTPIAVDDEESGVDQTTAKIAVQTLERLRSSQGGQSALLREITINFDVPGELFLHGHQDPDTGDEDWQVRSIDELVVSGNEFTLRGAPGATQGVAVPKDDFVIRLWERDSRFSGLATSPMRAVLGECESLLLLSREIRAVSKSRLSAGLLLMPEELSFGPVDPTRDSSDGEESDDPFDQELMDTLISPIQNEGSAASVAPSILRGPAEFLKEVRHLTFDRPLDAALDARIEARIMRIARALNMPVEVTTGLQETTFANAAQVKKSEWDAHGQPRAVMICDALTSGYFQPALEEAGISREQAKQLVVWYDPSEAIAAPDPSDNVVEAYKDGVISDEARRRVQGFSEGDTPDDLELLRRALINSTTLRDPNIVGQLLVLTGLAPDLVIPAPTSGGTETSPAPIAPGQPVVASGRSLRKQARVNPLGRKLMQIDRDLRTRLITASDSALKRTLERAGNRVVTKIRRDKSSSMTQLIASTPTSQLVSVMGPSLLAANDLTDGELLAQAFDDLAVDFDAWILKAQKAALRQLQTHGVKFSALQLDRIEGDQTRNREKAWDVLQPALVSLANKKLYETAAITASLTLLGEDDGSFDVPASLIRQAMGIAGGDTGTWIDITGAVLGTDGDPASGVANSSTLFDEAQVEVDGYQWVHGAPSNPFPPHEALDGQIFADFGVDALGNSLDFPGPDSLFPGDHAGCQCDVIPITAPASELDYLNEE